MSLLLEFLLLLSFMLQPGKTEVHMERPHIPQFGKGVKQYFSAKIKVSVHPFPWGSSWIRFRGDF